MPCGGFSAFLHVLDGGSTAATARGQDLWGQGCTQSCWQSSIEAQFWSPMCFFGAILVNFPFYAHPHGATCEQSPSEAGSGGQEESRARRGSSSWLPLRYLLLFNLEEEILQFSPPAQGWGKQGVLLGFVQWQRWAEIGGTAGIRAPHLETQTGTGDLGDFANSCPADLPPAAPSARSVNINPGWNPPQPPGFAFCY